MTRQFRVAVVQTLSSLGAWEENIDAAGAQVRSLARHGSRIIVLPELFATGYDLGTGIQELAEVVPGRTSRALTALAVETGTVLVTAIALRLPGGGISDSSLVVGPGGLLAIGHKRFLWAGEKTVFTPGQTADSSYRPRSVRSASLSATKPAFPRRSAISRDAVPRSWPSRQLSATSDFMCGNFSLALALSRTVSSSRPPG